MTTLKVVKYPHASLKKQCIEVREFNEQLIATVNDMLETMKANNGIGLAANQVDIDKRIMVANVSQPDREWSDKNMVFINPVITSTEGSISFREGCLSLPGIFEFVNRSEAVSVAYQDTDGSSKTIRADGILAVVIQHEVDHLNGKTLLDNISRLKRELILKKMHKAWLL